MTLKTLCAASVAACASGLLAGCGGLQPTVQYQLDRPQDYEGLTKFRLAKTAVLVDNASSRDGKSADSTTILLTAVPQEDESRTFSIAARSGVLSVTHLKVTKRENTELLESVGTEIEDKRIELIQQVGGILGTVLPFLAARATQPRAAGTLPLAIDVSSHLPRAARDAVTGQGILDNGWNYEIVIGDAPVDAINTDEFMQNHRSAGSSHVLFYSACRNATVKFKSGPFAGRSLSVRVSDPWFVQTVAMPAKGKIDFHSACGVNVTSERSDVASDAKVLNTLISQAKTLLDAKKK